MGFLIDTNLWIAIERGQLSAADIHAITGQQPIYMSPINIAEIRFGVELMRDPKQKQRAMATLRRSAASPCFAFQAKPPKSSVWLLQSSPV